MKAILLRDRDCIELAEVPVPEVGPGELLVRTGAATICTSDLNDIHENPFQIALPVVIGHEGAGTVAAIGQKVQGFQIGDRVATHPVHACGACSACREGDSHLCLNMSHFGINMPGTMGEYYRVRQDRARKIPVDMPFSLAALAEPVSVCLEALAQARLHPGQSLLILGDGPFGLMMARLAARMGLSQVVLAGWIDFRLGFARGVSTINTSQVGDPLSALRALAGEAGFDAAILAVASPQALNQGLALLKPKGRLVLFSAITGNPGIDTFSIHVRELEIIGACNDQDRLDEAVRSLSDASLAFGELVTHSFPLEDFEKAFAMAAGGKDQAIKVSLSFEAAL
jgi:threonine dehydrogenase-like Zn-dependent dehydrogenase